MNDSERKNLNVLPEMQAFAEQSVDLAKCAFDELVAVTRRAVSTVEGNTTAAQAAARELHGKAMGFAERNVAASLDFAQQLLRANDVEGVLRLQADFMSSQLQVLAVQARDLARQAATVGKSQRPAA